MPPEHRELLERMFRDLAQMAPAHIEFEILDDGWKASKGRLYAISGVMDWMTPCELAEQVVSTVQAFMSDTCSEWWPMVGRGTYLRCGSAPKATR